MFLLFLSVSETFPDLDKSDVREQKSLKPSRLKLHLLYLNYFLRQAKKYIRPLFSWLLFPLQGNPPT